MTVSPDALPAPLRRFLDRLGQLRSGDAPDMHQVGRLLTELAADEEYFAPLIAGPGSFDVHWLIKPEPSARSMVIKVQARTKPSPIGSSRL
jgi:hypothetical protein